MSELTDRLKSSMLYLNIVNHYDDGEPSERFCAAEDNLMQDVRCAIRELSEAEETLARAIQSAKVEAYEEAKLAVANEYLTDFTDDPTDEAYMLAIDHALAAIRKLGE